MDPEKAHDLALKALDLGWVQRLNRSLHKTDSSSFTCLGMSFPNRVGLAAGLDKNGDYIDALSSFGFGFIEIGTITPKPQPGNDKPRLFRLKNHDAIINRMGFNNKGVDHLVTQVQKSNYKGVLGINIGKNKSTAMENAAEDYVHCLEKVYPHADYVTVNVSSPNTQGLRDLQHGEKLDQLLESVKTAQSKLHTEHGRYVPIAIKIAPDMSRQEIENYCQSHEKFGMDALIIGNTTQQRDVVASSPHAKESGGLSGSPLYPLSNQKLIEVAKLQAGKTTIIGVGGITTGEQALCKIELGADLVQLYSGLIYQGPVLVCQCISQIEAMQNNRTDAFSTE